MKLNLNIKFTPGSSSNICPTYKMKTKLHHLDRWFIICISFIYIRERRENREKKKKIYFINKNTYIIELVNTNRTIITDKPVIIENISLY